MEYDRDLDILYIRLREGKYAFSEAANDNLVVDLGPEGEILAIELMDASEVFGRELLEKTLAAEAATITRDAQAGGKAGRHRKGVW
ncbi:MAG: DUF2283 domain-containing protein [Candidatus Bathyarchaeia archaeon]